jgi:GT2 family glycosyltransferase
MKDLSIIIVNYKTPQITKNCLLYLKKNLEKYPLNVEVLVVDNGSEDKSVEVLKKIESQWNKMKLFVSKKNLGFGKGNNLALKKAQGRYILFLNSDVYVENVDFLDLINLMDFDLRIGALTIKLILPNGEIDPASHRGFPTLFRSFTYFSGLEKLFYHLPFLNKIFGGYHLSHLNLNTVHEVEAISGAFFLTRKEIMDKISGFDEDYFAYGEDIENSVQA